MAFDAYYDFRRALVDMLERDVVGYGGEYEVLDDRPTVRYIAGILYPRGSGFLAPEQDINLEEGEEGEETEADPPVALANVKYPSSMGMTFAVDPRISAELSVIVKAARYRYLGQEPPEGAVAADTDDIRREREPEYWKREPIGPVPVTIDVTRPVANREEQITEGLVLFCRVRPADVHGMVPVTLVLLNKHTATDDPREQDANSFFQSEIRAEGRTAGSAPFVERPHTAAAIGNDEDLRSYRLLYRHAREYAVGHGCSVRWENAGEGDEHAVRVCTTFTPEYEVRLADSNPNIRLKALEMFYLSEALQDEAVRALEPLCTGYAEWIKERRTEARALTGELAEIASGHLAQCEEALQRMRDGLGVLAADSRAWEAFRLMNSAMLSQRARTIWLREGCPAAGPIEDTSHKWRPFQMAFILLCLPGIVRPGHPDRELADLLWFPTGGGKTEAYLGLIAFTLFLRRMRLGDGAGVTAIMRYTLRLLTIQQFERATLLICCCEEIRRRNPGTLGGEPVSIGLWIGQGATPNSLEEACTALNKLMAGTPVTEGNPVQVHSCPWCGTPLDFRNYRINPDKTRLVIACRRSECAFREGLPVHLVDSDIYAVRPTLIISTADKFAGITWNDKTAELFNITQTASGRHAPPELIIQDELHLISGPLGTLAGLYETAIDLLCTDRNGVRPKVIASTATIRRAHEQGHSLFNREVKQFPPSGLDARDSYFAVEAPRDDRGTRMYVGLMAPGTSPTTLLVRTYATLLQSVLDLPASEDVEESNRTKDPFWTLVGYFNSLRVLGGAKLQVQDDVDDRMGLLARAAGTKKREIDEPIELTSRVPSSNIPDYLKRMGESLGTTDEPVSVILATNMISVGVDVDRLGLMAVMGQPQSTSEYIQSTSRVGRRYPGLVVVLFNSARSRDRSHYESFTAYHSALYRQVESTSVTPYSARARDRALHAVLIALARQLIPQLRPNSEAGRVDEFTEQIDEIIDKITDRISRVAPEEVAAARTQLQEVRDIWHKKARYNPNLVYRDRDPSKALLIDAGEETDGEAGIPTLRSLRDVDRESNLYLIW